MIRFPLICGLRGFKALLIAMSFYGAIPRLSADVSLDSPEPLTADQRYWRRMHRLEEQDAKDDAQRIHSAREQVLSELGETRAAGDAFQAGVVLQQDGPAPVVKPSWLEGKREYILLSSVSALVVSLVITTCIRHRREAEIRALSGGYLTDGTEVARYKLPEWFAPPTIKWTEEPLGVESTPSTLDAAVNVAETRFFADAPQHLSAISESLRALVAEQEPARREQFLKDLDSVLSKLVASANVWELRPAWQIGSALQMLVERVAKKPADASESVLRTVAAALDVLHKVCVPGVRASLLIDPPVKVLAVDDEPLCRRALQFALEKAKLTADIAETGEDAIQLAINNAYDVVLMDIQMPGIDGFAACQRIHQTQKNAGVPVVFVTVLSDFNTRAKSRLEGGADLIAKPYLILELTVKAMTYIARKRLQLASREATGPLSNSIPTSARPQSGGDAKNPDTSPALAEPELSVDEIIALGGNDLDGDFLASAPRYIGRTRKLVEELRRTTALPAITRITSAVFLRIHQFTERASTNSFPMTAYLNSTLEALLKRLYNNPNAVTASTINTTAHALKVLASVSSPDAEAALVSQVPTRLLVAEDEPLARRAVLGALQLAFEKPDGASNGAKALALAAQNSYDVIFSDIQMPEMDGFEFCSALRAGGPNQQTPVVFITALKDIAAQARALECGGNDFISKPFLPIEITVKALAFAVERRLRDPARFNVPAPSAISPSGDAARTHRDSEAENLLVINA